VFVTGAGLALLLLLRRKDVEAVSEGEPAMAEA
jgi:hypothetical protein